jgi:hypothetical protein
MSSQPEYLQYKVDALSGRYITLAHIESQLIPYKPIEISKSVLGAPLYRIDWGSGRTKILMWSQMHGNESTTTKAVFDMLSFLESHPNLKSQISLRVLPMVNPDGASAYTRNNANDVDLNRDAIHLTQPESRFLRAEFDAFKPDFAFNLHDQRTMYGIDDKPATVSFLAPSADEKRQFGASRRKAACLISQIAKKLYAHIPNQIGRYDDAFNANCIGDAFQSDGVPTVLFEAGHYQNDYQREQTREFVFYALKYSIEAIVDNQLNDVDAYFNIPENQKHFFDILIKNTHYIVDNKNKRGDVGINFTEVKSGEKITFEPVFTAEGDLSAHCGHKVIVGNNDLVEYKFNESAHNCL